MSVVLLTSATGSPGVTTTALGLALTWPRHVLLADCDREPSQVLQAGYLRGLEHAGRGLMPLARLHRQGHDLTPEVWRLTLPLSEGEDIQRNFLPGFSAAGSGRLFDLVWSALGEAFVALEERGIDVIIDAGRISPAGLPQGLLQHCAAVLVCVRSSLRSLAGARIHLATVEEQVASLPVPAELAIALIGPGRPYSTAEILQQFQLSAWVEAPWEPALAEVLSDGSAEPKRFLESKLLRALRADAKNIFDKLHPHFESPSEQGVTP